MEFVVNQECIGCELCTQTCPEVFSMGPDGMAVAVAGDVPEGTEDAAVEAMENCPVGAIEQV